MIPGYFSKYSSKKLCSKRNKQLIVSLTTIPSRVEKVWIPIECMLRQSVRPDKIVLWLGKEKFRGIQLPEKLTMLRDKGLEIQLCDDIRAHTKYYYVMQQYSNAYIITIDDDIFYDRNMIKGLIKTYKMYPGTVCAHWVWKMQFTKQGKLLPSKCYQGGEFIKDVQMPSHSLLALGCGGVLYPPHWLKKETFELNAIRELSYAADDVWLKGMEILSGIKVSKVHEHYKPDVILSDTQKVALRHDNVAGEKNDQQLVNVFQRYQLTSYYKN